MAYTRYRAPNLCGVSGGVALRLLMCAASLLVLGAAIFVLTRTFEVRKANDYVKAEKKRDIGFQEAFNKLNPDGSQDLGWLREAFADVKAASGDSVEFKGEPDEDGANFSVVFKAENRGDTSLFKIVSTGSSGSVTQVQECTFRLEVSGENDSVWVNEGIR